MSRTLSTQSAAGVPSGIRPEWVRPARTATAFWMPVAAVLSITLALVLLWPQTRRHAMQNKSMPEASASYVLLEGSYVALPGNPLENPWPSTGSSAMPEREELVARRLPVAEYTGLGSMLPWMPAPVGAMSNLLPNLAARPVAEVLTGLPPATNSFSLTISAELQRSGFHFEVPPDVTTGMAMVARFYVELDDRGNVFHLLAEPGDNPAGVRQLETAISRGRGTRAGRGQVLVACGR
ncbi:MAG: hypothetical protein WCR06_07545 [bacterium]